MIEINSPKDFDTTFDATFGNVDTNTLSAVKKKLRLELGGEDDYQRLERAYNRAKDVLKYCFGGKPIWLRIILWSEKEEENLNLAGFAISKADKMFKKNAEWETLYIHYNNYSHFSLLPIVKSIINFDMAEDPSANVTCYFINFHSQLIVNIYDDRGLDIFSMDDELLKDIKNNFFDWVIN